MGLGPVAGRVDVGATGEHQAVETVEEPVGILERRLVGRQQQCQCPGCLHRTRIGAGRHRHGLVPNAPADPLDRSADPDSRNHL